MTLYWQETDDRERYTVPDDIQDLSFRLAGRSLPLDHAYALSTAIIAELPWMQDEPAAGIHLIHVAESGNGWYRPEDPLTELLHLSRRTRMTLRLPKHRLEDATALSGRTLDISGHAITVGESAPRPLALTTTLFARHVVAEEPDDEPEFLRKAVDELAVAGVRARKIMCGIRHQFHLPDGTMPVRRVLLADLEFEDAVRLQQEGLGEGRKLGCGLFLPHKGIRAVKADDD